MKQEWPKFKPKVASMLAKDDDTHTPAKILDTTISSIEV